MREEEQQPTPTPWEVIGPSDYAHPKAQCHYEIEADGLSVALTIGDEVPNEESNARFIVRAVNAHDALLSAAKRVLADLNTRIDVATATEAPVPIFDGIGDLHDAINLAEKG